MVTDGFGGPSGQRERRSARQAHSVERALTASALLPTVAFASLGTATVLLVAQMGMSPVGLLAGSSAHDGGHAVTTPQMSISVAPPRGRPMVTASARAATGEVEVAQPGVSPAPREIQGQRDLVAPVALEDSGTHPVPASFRVDEKTKVVARVMFEVPVKHKAEARTDLAARMTLDVPATRQVLASFAVAGRVDGAARVAYAVLPGSAQECVAGYVARHSKGEPTPKDAKSVEVESGETVRGDKTDRTPKHAKSEQAEQPAEVAKMDMTSEPTCATMSR